MAKSVVSFNRRGVVENENVTLEVLAEAATVGERQAVITWTLTAAPGEEPEPEIEPE